MTKELVGDLVSHSIISIIIECPKCNGVSDRQVALPTDELEIKCDKANCDHEYTVLVSGAVVTRTT